MFCEEGSRWQMGEAKGLHLASVWVAGGQLLDIDETAQYAKTDEQGTCFELTPACLGVILTEQSKNDLIVLVLQELFNPGRLGFSLHAAQRILDRNQLIVYLELRVVTEDNGFAHFGIQPGAGGQEQ